MKKDIYELVKEFCEFSHLQDNIDAEIPNLIFGMAGFSITPEEKAEWLDGWDWHNWDPLDDPLTMTSPEMLAYIVLVSKSFWEKKK